jgi:uncharacterized protein YhaN
MRLNALTLCRYGVFDSQRIPFDPAPGRINLLIAPNGAGKSIIRQAFCDLLFGIHAQTSMGFRFGYAGMKLMAEAVGPDGTSGTFGRRKGQGKTLVDADGAPLGETELARLLGHTDRALLERLFALDTERLRKGGEELLASDGAVADALLSAAGGLRRARQLRQNLEQQRDSKAPIRKSATRPYYVALERFTGAGQRLRAVTLKPQAREKQETELRRIEADQVQLNRVAAHTSQQIAKLERIRRGIGPLAAYDEAAAWLRDHPAAPILPLDTRQHLTEARTALLNAEQLQQREMQARQAIAEQIEGIAIDAALIENAEAIEHPVGRAGAARQASLDIPKREAEHAAASKRIALLLHQLGRELPIERAEEAIPPKAAMIRARNLLKDYIRLRAELERLPTEIANAETEIADTQAAIQRLAEPQDLRDMQRLLRGIRADGEPGQRVQEIEHQIAQRRGRLLSALARAPGWTRDAGALIALSPLSHDAYGRLEKARAKAKQTLENRAEALIALRRSLAEDERRLEEITRGRPIPDSATIAAARERRDGGWRLIYQRAFMPEPPNAEQEQAWAGETPLPLAYERSVAATDALADRRNQESERLVQVAELQRRIAKAAADIDKAEADREEAERAHDERCNAWKTACEPFGFSLQPELKDITEILSARERVIEADRELKVALAAKSAMVARYADWSEKLMAALGLAFADATALLELLHRADEWIALATEAEAERNRLRAKLDEQRRTRDRACAEHDAARRRLIRFNENWSATRCDLARPDTEDPGTTIELLELITTLEKEHGEAVSLRARLHQMLEEIVAFRNQARELVTRIAPDLAERDAFEIVEEMRRRLIQYRELLARRTTLLKQLEAADAAVAQQQENHAHRADALSTILQVIGAETVEDAEERVGVAEERIRRQRALDSAAHELLVRCDGYGIDQLREEVAEVVIDEVPARITELDNERAQANAAAQDLAGQMATMRADMDRQAHDNEMQAVAAERQAAIAAIRQVLEEAALMHLANLLLYSSLETVERAGTSVLLTRIGELFRTITDDAYLRIEADDPGDGSARLVAVEHGFPEERKTVAELSEGSRDQLFLALRLAAIEEHVATAPPLPFLGDDILQTFDDDRAAAAMQALLQLSESVQVILLSHHRHLLGVAQRLPAERIHICEITPSLVA